MKKISILDLGVSNLFSIQGLFDKIGYETKIIKSSKDFHGVDILVIPGVGAFPAAMQYLEKQNLVDKVKEHFLKEKPLIGICLGMQLLFERSVEFGDNKGLGLIKGNVIEFKKEKLKTHIGWNKIKFNQNNDFYKSFNLQKNLDENYFYFVHSYYPVPENKDLILSYSNFNSEKFCSSICHKNILALQFHPEKSSSNGIKLIENFLNFIDEND